MVVVVVVGRKTFSFSSQKNMRKNFFLLYIHLQVSAMISLWNVAFIWSEGCKAKRGKS